MWCLCNNDIIVVKVKTNIFVSKNKESGIKQVIGAICSVLLKAISACEGRLDNEIFKNDN